MGCGLAVLVVVCVCVCVVLQRGGVNRAAWVRTIPDSDSFLHSPREKEKSNRNQDKSRFQS